MDLCTPVTRRQGAATHVCAFLNEFHKLALHFVCNDCFKIGLPQTEVKHSPCPTQGYPIDCGLSISVLFCSSSTAIQSTTAFSTKNVRTHYVPIWFLSLALSKLYPTICFLAASSEYTFRHCSPCMQSPQVLSCRLVWSRSSWMEYQSLMSQQLRQSCHLVWSTLLWTAQQTKRVCDGNRVT